PAYEDVRLRAALLPALRSDLACLADIPQPRRPLDAVVRVIRGVEDPVVSPRDWEGWGGISRHPVTETLVPGRHMHPLEEPEAYAQALREVTSSTVGLARRPKPGAIRTPGLHRASAV